MDDYEGPLSRVNRSPLVNNEKVVSDAMNRLEDSRMSKDIEKSLFPKSAPTSATDGSGDPVSKHFVSGARDNNPDGERRRRRKQALDKMRGR